MPCYLLYSTDGTRFLGFFTEPSLEPQFRSKGKSRSPNRKLRLNTGAAFQENQLTNRKPHDFVKHPFYTGGETQIEKNVL